MRLDDSLIAEQYLEKVMSYSGALAKVHGLGQILTPASMQAIETKHANALSYPYVIMAFEKGRGDNLPFFKDIRGLRTPEEAEPLIDYIGQHNTDPNGDKILYVVFDTAHGNVLGATTLQDRAWPFDAWQGASDNWDSMKHGR